MAFNLGQYAAGPDKLLRKACPEGMSGADKVSLIFLSISFPFLLTANSWVNFQVMRRTHASLMNKLEVDPKVMAEQLGHTLDVTLNIYTEAGHERRKKAVNML